MAATNINKTTPELSVSELVSKTPGLLALPRELRDLIIEHLLYKENNTITMIDSFGSSATTNDISARPPSICAVNRQLRAEALPLYLAGNVFTAQLDNAQDLHTTNTWLDAIGNDNIQHLKHLTLSGFTTVPFGHMISRRWITIALDLKAGTMEVKNRDGTTAVEQLQPPGILSTIEEFQSAFKKVVDARDGQPFDLEGVKQLVMGFSLLCTGY